MSKPLIDDDGEVRELTEADFKRAVPMRLRHPEIPCRVRGPQKMAKKIPLSIRLSPEVVDYFKAEGKGWQTRIDQALKNYIAHQANR